MFFTVCGWALLVAGCCADVPAAAGQQISSGDYRITFPEQRGGGYGLRIAPVSDSGAVVLVDRPAQILVKNGSAQPAFAASYSSLTSGKDGSVVAEASVKTAHGSRFAVRDVYRKAVEPGTFVLVRRVSVQEANAADEGFNSRFSAGFARPAALGEYHFFAPGIWYDKNSHVAPRAIAGDYNHDYFYYRETRSGLPFLMMQDDATGTSLSLAHVNPRSASGADETSPDWLVDASVQYAALGVHKKPAVALAFVYPACEGEKTYVRGADRWVRRSHPVRPGFSHGYTIGIAVSRHLARTGRADYRAAYTHAWRTHYRLFDPPVHAVPMKTVYEDGIALLDTYSACRNGAWGWPFVVLVPDGTVPPDKISYQMGFVGEQIPAAFQMIRYGLLRGNQAILDKGIATMEFWVSRAATPSGLPLTWYNVTPPTFRDNSCRNPIFLRIVSDGMEGALDAARVMREHHQPRAAWDRFVTAYGDWLVGHQNPDGSFYRAYNPDGTVFRQRDGCNRSGFGESKLNTTHPVRFLVALYFATGEKRYLVSALTAGEFAFKNIYQAGLYVGGTADNPNTLDKEAGVQALHAFLALHDATGEARWLEAAADAATFTETWMYAWNFAIRDAPAQYAYAGIEGQSLIATGHSATDVYLGFAAYDFYRLHLLRNDAHFLDVARNFANNTKLTTQLTGLPAQQFGFAHAGLVGEAVGLSNLRYIDSSGAHSWLPWVTIAEIEALQKLEDVFGSMSIDEIERVPGASR